MKLSNFGNKLAGHSGIGELMDDLGQAMGSEALLMLGGGNPASIPEVQSIWREELQKMMDEPGLINGLLTDYDSPQGKPAFLNNLADFLNRHYGWNISADHITITNGSQNSFFFLFNMLAGEQPDGSFKKILLPLIPEYIGYADQGIQAGMFQGNKPAIEMIDEHHFKYHVDFNTLEVGDDIAAICVSRPTNPTGNVLDDEEIRHLSQLAKAHDIPLIIDNAYGSPFPGIIFSEVTPQWDDHLILSMSLSKLGLPGTRTGIIIAQPDVIKAVTSVNAIVSLANGNIGQGIVAPLLANDRIQHITEDLIKPFYQAKRDAAAGWVKQYFPEELPWALHKTEGALFMWLWAKDLPIDSYELYNRLKDRNVLVIPGKYFFYGLEDEEWTHCNECIRINYTQPAEVVEAGLKIIAEELVKAYKG